MSEGAADVDWRELYDLASRIKTLAPWAFMYDSDIFGVRDAHSDEVGYVSVMGALGEYYAIALYFGARGLDGFHAMMSGEDNGIDPLAIPHVQLSFGDRTRLEARDRQIMRDLGLSFRGRNAWPMFRSYRPGCVPWFLQPDEGRRLAEALGQLLEVAPRAKTEPTLFAGPGDGRCVVRERSTSGAWEDRTVPLPAPEPYQIPMSISSDLLDRGRTLPHTDLCVEVDVFRGPMVVDAPDDPSGRPQVPYVVLLVDGHSGLIVGTDLLNAVDGLEQMWGRIPGAVLASFVKVARLPATISVRTALLVMLLEPLAERLGIRIRQARSLKRLDAAKRALFDSMGPR